jgi:hypothetical protein
MNLLFRVSPIASRSLVGLRKFNLQLPGPKFVDRQKMTKLKSRGDFKSQTDNLEGHNLRLYVTVVAV